MNTGNTISLIPSNSATTKLEIDKEYIFKPYSCSVWTDGDIRVMCSIEPHACTELAPSIDYESQEFKDDLQEILDDTISEGEGRPYPKYLVHHLQKRGYKLIRE